MKSSIIFFHKDMEYLAKEINKKNVSIRLGEVDWGNFPDGFPNLKIHNADDLDDKDVIFLTAFNNEENIFRQMAVIFALASYPINSLKIVIPFFPGTMDRVDYFGQVATAKTLARILSSIQPVAKAQIFIYDIHALQEQFYFGDNVRVKLLSAISTFKQELVFMNDVAIAFPDDGAYKRFKNSFPEYEKIICNKVRKGEERIVTVKEGDPVRKNIIIVDDLIMSGGTLIECKNALMNSGAKSVSAYATHGVFPQNSWLKFVDSDFEKIWVTNSCPSVTRKLEGKDKFKVLSLADSIIGDIIR